MKQFWSISAIYFYFIYFTLKSFSIFCTSVIFEELKFIVEPPNRVDFLNTMEVVIECKTSSTSKISWHRNDGTNWSLVSNITGLRIIRPYDNSLVFSSFRANDYNPSVHSSIYRCFASNLYGTIASRNVFVRAVILESYQINVYDEYVIRGSIAVFKCQIPSFIKEYLVVTSWIRDDGFVINNSLKTGAKYFIINGDLFIKNSDGSSGHSYKCNVRNKITGETRLSSSAGKLIVTDPSASIHPRIKMAQKEVIAEVGSDAYLVCVAQGFPTVSYQWIKSRGDSDSLKAHFINEQLIDNSGILLLRNVLPDMRGVYSCLVNNSIGRDRFDTKLIVKQVISVQLIVSSNKLEVGKEILLNCSISGSPINSLKWTKNGLPLSLNSRTKLSNRLLTILSATRDDIGCYSCRINDETESIVSSKCLYLSEEMPRFKSTFRQHILRTNDRLSLRCIASGTPIPTIIWSIDSNPIPDNHRIQFGDYVSSNGDIITSYVNVSHVRVEDNGIYECKATNSAGSVTHHESIAVIGSLFIRQMSNISVIDGETLVFRCPSVQIEPKEPKIVWTKANKELSLISERHKVYENGTFVIRDMNRESDSGIYTCRVISRSGEEIKQDLYIDVLKKPVLSQFSFPSSLTSGMRVIITCSILEGDHPIKLFWLFDGQPISGSFFDVEEISMGDMGSSLLFRNVNRKHSGLYTCIAQNSAGNTTYSAKMIVRVPPVWKIEPNDKSVIIGETVRFDCQSDGFPVPVIRWKASTGNHKNDFKSVSSNYHIQSLENGSLVIKEVEKSDQGLYVCEAGNGVGVDISIVVKLSVNIGAHFKKSFQVIRVLKGDTIRISCEAFGEKPLSIKWIRDRNDIDLISDKKYTITEKQTIDGLVSELMSPSAERTDSAQFGCLAVNLYGQSDLNSQLLVEEVPDAPNGLQVVDITSRSVSLKWSIPFSGNNPISKYIIHWKTDKDLWNTNSYSTEFVSKIETQISITDLKPLTKYNFRVYAINGIGKSEFSEISAKTDEEMPSHPPKDIKVFSLSSKSLKISWKPPNENLMTTSSVKGYYIGYKAVNSEKPTTFKTVEFTHTKDMEFILSSLEKSTKYLITVQAFNNKGAGPQSQEVFGETFESDPPSAPKLKLFDTLESTSVNLSWIIDDENPIRGFRIYYRRIPEEWEEYRNIIDGNLRTFTITGLRCGSNYQFYIIAFNDVGVSPASEMVSKDLTKVGVGSSPERTALISINSTQIELHLNSWKSFGFCKINYFSVQYKEYKQIEWTIVSNNVSPDLKILAINGLKPSLWYNLLISAHSDGDIVTEAEYVFATLTESGGTIAPMTASVTTDTADKRYNRYFIILIPISCAISVLLVISFVIIYICLRRTNGNQTNGNGTDSTYSEIKRDSISMTQIVKKEPKHETHSQTSLYSSHYPIPYATSRFTEMSSGYSTSGQQNASLNDVNQYDLPVFAKAKRVESQTSNEYQSLLLSEDPSKFLNKGLTNSQINRNYNKQKEKHNVNRLSNADENSKNDVLFGDNECEQQLRKEKSLSQLERDDTFLSCNGIDCSDFGFAHSHHCCHH